MNAAQWINYDYEKRYIVTNSKLVPLRREFEDSNANPAPTVEKVVSLFSVRLDSRTIFIQDLGDTRLSLRKPLPISIEVFSNQVIAYSYDVGEFAFANDDVHAIEELQALIVDLYFLLKEEQNKLGPLPQKYWNFIKSVVQEN